MNRPLILSDDGRMPPKLDDDIKRLNIVAPTSWVKRIDAWRGRQADVPNLSEAIRRLVDMALEAESLSGKIMLDCIAFSACT